MKLENEFKKNIGGTTLHMARAGGGGVLKFYVISQVIK